MYLFILLLQSARSRSSLPSPLHRDVQIKKIEERYIAAHRFSGTVDLNTNINRSIMKQQIVFILRALVRDGLITCSSSSSSSSTSSSTSSTSTTTPITTTSSTSSSSSSSSTGGGGEGERGSNPHDRGGCSSDDNELIRQLEEGRIKAKEENKQIELTLAVYNSPFCLPFFRRNEIWVSLPKQAVKKS